MNTTEIFDQVRHAIEDVLYVTHGELREEITWNTPLADRFGADSFELAQIALSLEEFFHIEFSSQEIVRIGQTPGNFVKAITGKSPEFLLSLFGSAEWKKPNFYY